MLADSMGRATTPGWRRGRRSGRVWSAVMSKEGTSSKRAALYVPLPFTTFGDLLSFGLEIQVWCLPCHTMRRAIIPAEKLRTRFAGKRFRCRCGAPGYPSIRPGPMAPKGGDTITDLYCPRCLPPREIRDVRLDAPPWMSAPLAKGQNYVCPGCRRPVLMHMRKEPPSVAPFAPWSHLLVRDSRKPD
jgi:hypothetical protein